MKAMFLLASPFLFTLAHGEIIGVEQFDYPNAAIADQSGGTFWDYKNVSPEGHTTTASDWDAVSGTPVVTAGRLVTGNTSAKREYEGPGEGLPPSDEGNGAVNDANVHKVVYYRVTLTTGASVPDFFGISSYDFGSEILFFGKRSGQTKFGIDETGVDGTDSTTTPDILPNTTYTLVARIDYTDSPSGNIVSLHIDPDLNAAEPAPAVSRAYTGTNWSTAVRLASGSGEAITWDNLVVATTWDDLGTEVTTTADEDDEPTSLNTPADISLREAVKYSPAGSLITFAQALNGQTCTLSLGNMLIDKTLTIDASALANGVTINANQTSRHFYIAGSTASITLKALSLINGNGGGNFGDFGGAILLFNGNLFLQRCTLSGNFAESGGAIWLQGFGTSRLEECTITGNRATAGNGGIAVLQGICTLSRCTISGNTGTGGGGGLYLQSPASVSLSNCLIAGNTDSLDNDISKSGGTLTPIGNNLIGSNASVESLFSPGPLVGTQSAPLDPKLSPLGYFGGPTMTMHPLIGSPAIDAGGTANPGGTDQRGFPRFVNGDNLGGSQLDIGAVEAGRLLTVSFAGDAPNVNNLRAIIAAAPSFGPSLGNGTRIGFSPVVSPIILTQGDLIPVAGNSLFLDASNLPGGVTISGNNAGRVFNIPAATTVAMHSLNIINGKAPDGAVGAFVNGRPGEYGGAILNAGSLSIYSSTISGNRAGDGGDSTGSDITSGGEGGRGGGIYSGGPLILTASIVSGNVSGRGGNASGADTNGGNGGDGGGVFADGPLALTATTISGNTTGQGGLGHANGSSGFGGGIAAESPTTVRSSTVSGNRATLGGGIFMKSQQELMVEHSTVAGNSADDAGGGILHDFQFSPLKLRHSIVASNTAPTGPDIHLGAVTFQNANLLGTPVTSPGSTTGPTPIINSNPLLAPLGDYGGPTPTMALRPGSPAINAAAPNEVQQINIGSLPINFTLTFKGQTTASLDQSSTASQVQTALTGLSAIGAGNVSVTQGSAGLSIIFTVTFTGALASGDQPPITSNTASVTTLRDGNFPRTADQRGFPTVGLPDIGAYEAGTLANNNARIWETSDDFDGDGASNLNEFSAGTALDDASSNLRITATVRNGANLAVTFTTVPARSYILTFSDTLTGTWTNTGLPAIAGNGGLKTFTIPAPVTGVPKRFYRIELAP